MPLKTPGSLNKPPPQNEFDQLPLGKWCVQAQGVFYRLHSLNRSTGKPWPPIHFSQAGRTRFDPNAGPGTLYVGETLDGVLLEIFDDSWGSVNSTTRSLTKTQLQEWWVTLIAVPSVTLFDARKNHLSKIGTDSQLLSGDHATSREWALSLARHPLKVGGLYYPSRHDGGHCNLAVFRQRVSPPERFASRLKGPAPMHGGWKFQPTDPLVYGPPVLLRDHPELQPALMHLEVVLLP